MRQLLNALRVVAFYNRLRQNPDLEMTPRAFFFAGKAAPPFHLAAHHQVPQQLGRHHRRRPGNARPPQGRFLPEYCVSLAERLIPATDVSNQISTAGYERGRGESLR